MIVTFDFAYFQKVAKKSGSFINFASGAVEGRHQGKQLQCFIHFGQLNFVIFMAVCRKRCVCVGDEKFTKKLMYVAR